MEIQNKDFDSSSLPQVKWHGDEVYYQFHGCWIPPVFLQGTQRILDHFKPLSNDVILASFPKTGTTWLKSLVYSIVNRSSIDQLTKNHPHRLVPQLELQVYGPLGSGPPYHFPSPNTPSTRILSTHLPYQIFGKAVNDSSDCRVIYVTRNPKDTIVSLWHMVNAVAEKAKVDPMPLEQAVDKFCQGVAPFGPYYDHVLGYHKESMEKPKKFFFITYEELKSDPKAHVKGLAEFLGCPFENDEQVEEVVRSCSIETLKNHEVNKSSDVPPCIPLPYNSFFRKGEVGDHKNHLTRGMIDRIDAITREKFHGSSFNLE